MAGKLGSHVRVMKKLSMVVSAVFVAAFLVMPAQAREEKIETGIYVDEIDLSGMTKSEAGEAIEDYVSTFGGGGRNCHHGGGFGTRVGKPRDFGQGCGFWPGRGHPSMLQGAARSGI